MSELLRPAVFFDRDGTINVDFGYTYKVNELIFVKGIPELIKKYNDIGYLVIVITNQSGIARGLFGKNDVIYFHNEINRRLRVEYGAHVDAFYFCPHHPDFNSNCECRKPQNGLFVKAIDEWKIDVSQSLSYGDSLRDEIASRAVGIKDFYYVRKDGTISLSDKSKILRIFNDSIDVKNLFMNNKDNIQLIEDCANCIVDSLKMGGKLLLCGNGGSASDALHIAGEILGRFQKERPGYAAVALNADVSTMTAVANDYSFDDIYSRQIEGLLKPNDIVLGISTSGNSKNIVNAITKAKQMGGKTIVLTGKDGGKLKQIADISIIVQSDITARIQECHMCIYHIICELVEDKMVAAYHEENL